MSTAIMLAKMIYTNIFQNIVGVADQGMQGEQEVFNYRMHWHYNSGPNTFVNGKRLIIGKVIW